MKRRAIQSLFVMGLLLTLTAAFFSVRSFWAWEAVRVARQWADGDWRTYAYANLSVDCGQVQLLLRHHRRTYAQTRIDNDSFQPTGFVAFHFVADADPSSVRRGDPDAPPWERLGFHYHTEAYWLNPTPGLSEREVDVPAWFVVLALAGLTAIPYARLRRDARRRMRVARGLCLACGYELRGADHERCPECGHLVSSDSHGEPSSLSKMK